MMFGACVFLFLCTVVSGVTILRYRSSFIQQAQLQLNAKSDNNDLAQKLQDAQEENLKLSTQLLEDASKHITPQLIDNYIKSHSKGFEHEWLFVQRSAFVGAAKENKDFRDELITEQCKYCGAQKAYWKTTIGYKMLDKYAVAGIFLNGKEVDKEFERICQSRLPIEFAKTSEKTSK